MTLIHKIFAYIVVFVFMLSGSHVHISKADQAATPLATSPSLDQAGESSFLPLVMNAAVFGSQPKINVPVFPGTVPMSQMAVFWFGKVTPDDNYIDVRAGYNSDGLNFHIAVFDRRLWCSHNPSESNLSQNDSIELFLNTGTAATGSLSSTAYRITGQLGSWDCDEHWTVYQGSSAGWKTIPFSFTGSTVWRGNAPNDNSDDRGWSADYQIPFSSLGLNSAPASGAVWKLGLVVHDRNDSAGTLLSQKQWPDNFSSSKPSTWGDMSFGLPTYTAPAVPQTGSVSIRNKLDGATVPDAQVGGGTVCGDDLDFWTQWGEKTYPNSEDNDQVNVQNQGDVADWPCYSKYYVTFPLTSVPAGKVILSAQLQLHQFGNSGGDPGSTPYPSLIQVFLVGQDWSDEDLTWNNAPQMIENVSQGWVDPLASFPGFPGVLRTWDVSRAVALAYANGTPLRLALYSADENYHSGKYFVSSDTGDWNAEGRPELKIVYGNP